MSDLAEIWFQRGEVERANALLIECMQQLVEEIKGSSYAKDRDTFTAEYQHHRATFLRLFPAQHQRLIEIGLVAGPNSHSSGDGSHRRQTVDAIAQVLHRLAAVATKS